MLDMLQPFSTSVSVDAWLVLIGCCAEVSCQYKILKHRKISGGPREIGSGMGGKGSIYIVWFPFNHCCFACCTFHNTVAFVDYGRKPLLLYFIFSCPTNRASSSCSVREIFGLLNGDTDMEADAELPSLL